MEIFKRKIGLNEPTYFIAEIGSNFDGDLNRAKELIKIAAENGADAAKFQHYTADTLVSDFGFNSLNNSVRTHQSEWKDSVSATYDKASLNKEWTEELSDLSHSLGIGFFTSPYSLDLVDYVEPYVDAYKVGSGDITYLEIIKAMSQKKKPLIIATGAASQLEVDKAIGLLEGNLENVCIMQCNTNYENNDENFNYQNLNVLKKYAELFPGAILGLSCHSKGWTGVLGSVALGARVIEKHFTDDDKRNGPDHKFATTPSEWRRMVEETRSLESMLGDGSKKVEQNELMTVIVQQRCLRAKEDMSGGEIITKDKIEVLRPCPEDGIKPFEINKVIGKKILNPLKKGEHFSYDLIN